MSQLKGAARLQAASRLRQRPPTTRGRIVRALEAARVVSTQRRGSPSPALPQPSESDANAEASARTPTREVGDVPLQQPREMLHRVPPVQRGGRKRSQGRGRGRHNDVGSAPPGWVAPHISPTRHTPLRLRKRPAIRGGAVLNSEASRAHDTLISPIGSQRHVIRRPRRGPGPRSPAEVLPHAAQGGHPRLQPRNGTRNSTSHGGSQRGGSGRGVSCNLNGAFNNAEFVDGWLEHVVNLADIDVPTVHGRALPIGRFRPRGSHVGTVAGSHAANTANGESSAGLPAGDLIPCIPGGPNGPGGRPLPSNVWVRLDVLGFDPGQWGGLQSFLGEVQRGWWEDGVHWLGIEFGGGIGWRKVAMTDCQSLNWREQRPPPFTRPGPSTPPLQQRSTPHDGSDYVPCAQRELSVDSVSPNSPSMQLPAPLGAGTTPAEDNNFPQSVPAPSPMSNLDGWTEDSADLDWMAEYRDFAGNFSADENSDWDLADDRSIHLSDTDGLDRDTYLQFVEAEGGNPEIIGTVRERYADACWGQHALVLLGDRSVFTGPTPGPTERGRRRQQNERYFFDLFWEQSTIDRLVCETNRYARQEVTEYASQYLNGGPKWIDITPSEFKSWLGVVILMGMKVTSTIRDYWRKESFWHCNVIASVMTRDRFECILRCLHCVDNHTLETDKNSRNYDKIGKVRWVVDRFVSRSRELWNPEKFVTVDEIMIAYRGHFSPIRQYIKAKPTRYGLKVWCLVSNPSRYIYNLQVYLGSNGNTEHGQGARVVNQLVSGMSHKGHCVVVDNFFTSPELFDQLLERGIWATGTVTGGRVGVPSILLGFKRGEHERGTLFWQMHLSQRMAATTWYDAKPVTFLSTSQDPIREEVFAQRWINGNREPVPTTPQQEEYQKYMRGVDLIDQMRRDYSVQFWSRKWWHKLWFFVLDSSLQNSWVLYCAHMKAKHVRPLGRKVFYYTVALALIQRRWPLPRTSSALHRNPQATHCSVRSEGRWPRQCVVCKTKQPRICRECRDVYMCDNPCFRIVHSSRKWAMRLAAS